MLASRYISLHPESPKKMRWTINACTMLPGIMASLWLAMFAFSRLFMLYNEYQSEIAMRADDQWLRAKCKDPEFFHNMKQHTDLCIKVEQNGRRSCLMVAMNNVISSTYLCGYRSCADYASSFLQWVMNLSLPFILAATALLLLTPTMIYPMYCAYLNRLADRRVMSLYNTPYGMQHYIDTHTMPQSYQIKME